MRGIITIIIAMGYSAGHSSLEPNWLHIKSYIETLSYDALIVLANECGIDVPQDLERSFLIGDLLEVAAEENEDDNMIVIGDTSVAEYNEHTAETPLPPPDAETTEDALQVEHCGNAEQSQSKQTKLTPDEETLSDTCLPSDIAMVMSGPIWAYVYWNVGGRDAQRSAAIFVRINTFDTPDGQTNSVVLRLDDTDNASPVIAQEVTEGTSSARPASRANGQYILIPSGHRFVQLELVALDEMIADCSTDAYEAQAAMEQPQSIMYRASVAPSLATSAIFEMSHPNPLLMQGVAALTAKLTPMQALSGMKKLLKEHYRDYRLTMASGNVSVASGNLSVTE